MELVIRSLWTVGKVRGEESDNTGPLAMIVRSSGLTLTPRGATVAAVTNSRSALLGTLLYW